MRVWAFAAIGGIVFFLAAGQTVAEAMPNAAAFSVDTTEDSVDAAPGDGVCEDAEGLCSLRAAVAETNALPGADTITVPGGTYELTLPENPEGHLVVTDDLTVTGAGASATIITQPGGLPFDRTRIFELPCGERVLQIEITGVTISGGQRDPKAEGGHGGGVDNCGNTVHLRELVLANNFAELGAGAFNDGGSVDIRESLITNNAGHWGAAVYDLSNTTTPYEAPRIALTNVTVSGNLAHDLLPEPGGGSSVVHRAALNNVSIVGNSAPAPKHSYIIFGATLKNSLLADNSGNYPTLPPLPVTCGFTSLGHNLSDDERCRGHEGTDIVAPEVGVGPLADNGGPTQTHALLPGSVAINGGDNDGCPATDQRGVARPQGGACDIGAFELEVTATPTPAPTATPTQAAAALPPTGGEVNSGEPALALVALGVTIAGAAAAGYYWLGRRARRAA